MGLFRESVRNPCGQKMQLDKALFTSGFGVLLLVAGDLGEFRTWIELVNPRSGVST